MERERITGTIIFYVFVFSVFHCFFVQPYIQRLGFKDEGRREREEGSDLVLSLFMLLLFVLIKSHT